jgi:hypothetical protein
VAWQVKQVEEVRQPVLDAPISQSGAVSADAASAPAAAQPDARKVETGASLGLTGGDAERADESRPETAEVEPAQEAERPILRRDRQRDTSDLSVPEQPRAFPAPAGEGARAQAPKPRLEKKTLPESVSEPEPEPPVVFDEVLPQAEPAPAPPPPAAPQAATPAPYKARAAPSPAASAASAPLPETTVRETSDAAARDSTDAADSAPAEPQDAGAQAQAGVNANAFAKPADEAPASAEAKQEASPPPAELEESAPRSRAAEPASTGSGQFAREPAKWLEQIEALIARGDIDAARRELEALRRAHPAFAIPVRITRRLD